MQTSFENLSPNVLNQLAQLVQKIASTIRPEKILCFGYRTSYYKDWSCFKEDTTQETINATFDLLIVTHNDNKLADYEILQKVDQLTDILDCEVTAVVQSLESVNELIAKNSRFLTTIYHKAVLVYNAGNRAIIVPPAAPSFEEIRHKLQTNWNKCYSVAERFFKYLSLKKLKQVAGSIGVCACGNQFGRSSIEKDMLSIYFHLSKFVEAAHMIDVRETNHIGGIPKNKIKAATH